MRFLVDECTGPGVARWLTRESHDAVSIYDEARYAEHLPGAFVVLTDTQIRFAALDPRDP